MRRTRCLTVVLAVLFTLPAAAHASGWSAATGFTIHDKQLADEAAPRVAIASDGTSVAAWIRGTHVVTTTGDSKGHFGGLHDLGRWAAVPPAVAAAPGGAAVIAWEAPDGIHIANRRSAGGIWRKRLIASSSGSAISGVTIERDPRGAWYIAERQFPKKSSSTSEYTIRTFRLRDDASHVTGPVQQLGKGNFGINARPVSALAVTSRGTATLAYEGSVAVGSGTRSAVFVTSAAHGTAPFGDPESLGSASQGLSDPWVSPVGSDGALIAATVITRCGDAGCFGAPYVWRANNGQATPLGGPTLTDPGLAFGPSVAPLGNGAAALVFQLKTHPAAFSRVAPVRASVVHADGTTGPLQTLTSSNAAEPESLPLAGSRVLVIWSGAKGFGAALAHGDGAFHTTPAPGGPPPSSGHTNATNRDADTAGNWAAITWVRDGRVRIRIRHF